jgi:hypothetical protein
LDDARAAGSASDAAIEAELRAALVAEAEANARLDNLGGAFAAARSGTGSLSLPAEGKKFPTAYGPVLFVVEQRNTLDTNGDNKPDDQPTVRLRALAPQRAFDTSTFARVEEMPAAAGTEALTLELEGDRFLTAVGGTFPPAFAKIVGGKAASIAGTPKLRNLDKDMDVPPSLVPNVEVVEDGTRLRYQLKPGTPPAEAYSLIIDLKRADGGPTKDASIIFGVR